MINIDVRLASKVAWVHLKETPDDYTRFKKWKPRPTGRKSNKEKLLQRYIDNFTILRL